MSEKIYLGKVRKDYKGYTAGEMVYLTKHSWDCGWYWGMGYIGNRDLHTHFDSEFLKGEGTYNITDIFEETKITQDKWWILRDLFVQAYALKRVAEVYKHGGHQTTKKGITDIIKNEEMTKILNDDLGKILNKIWEVLETK